MLRGATSFSPTRIDIFERTQLPAKTTLRGNPFRGPLCGIRASIFNWLAETILKEWVVGVVLFEAVRLIWDCLNPEAHDGALKAQTKKPEEAVEGT